MSGVISAIFTAVGSAITSFSSALASGVNSVTSIFYTTGDNAGLTFLGVLLTIAIGVGVVYWAFRMIKGLIRRA